MSIKIGEPVHFECGGEGKCLCGVHITIGYANGHPTVIHPLPTCKTFDRFESPIDYLHYINHVIENRVNVILRRG